MKNNVKNFLIFWHEQPDFQLEVIFNLFIASGIRAGELIALYWEDIDLDTGTLHVSNTLVKVNDKYIRQKPKTRDSERSILLPSHIVELLKRHNKTKQAEKRLKMGAMWKNPELVFTNKSGGFFLGSNINHK